MIANRRQDFFTVVNPLVEVTAAINLSEGIAGVFNASPRWMAFCAPKIPSVSPAVCAAKKMRLVDCSPVKMGLHTAAVGERG